MKDRVAIKKIVAGKYKGKTIKLPSATTTRSSKSIVLESFFNTLQFEIVESTFVELFSGSGSVGLEALSRGAKEIIFMEKDRDALKILKSNIAKTNPNACSVYGGDSFENINAIVSKLKSSGEDAYFYVDPPFSIREGMEDIYEKTIQLITALPTSNVKLIVIEHMSGLDIPNKIGAYQIKKSKKFGNTTLTYFTSENME